MSRIRIEDWSMPDPDDPELDGAMHRARYELSRLTQADAFRILACAEAYLHFAAHPATTESIVLQLRKLRRVLRERRP